MRRNEMTLRTLLLATVAVLSATAVAQAAELKEIGKIPVKFDAPLQGFDIGWYDAKTDRYILSSRGSFNPKDKSNPGNNCLIIVDTTNDKLIGIAAGTTMARGSVIVNDGAEAWVGDGDNSIKIVDMKTNKIVGSIPTEANKGGADELNYSPKDNVVAMALPDAEPPTLILINTKDRKIFAKVPVPNASDGFEQTIYSEVDGNFHTVIPELGAAIPTRA